MTTRSTEQLMLQPGTILAGRYRIDRVLGRGGFAQVFLGRHVEVDSLQVAIKVLHATHQDREAVVSRFRREARLLALLRNRHTVRLIDFGFADDSMGYLVMEYVRGASLDRLIAEQAPMRPTDVARVGIGVLKALDEAHSIGVIHRDLKPANVLLINEPGERHAVPRVLDFGIAKVLGVSDAVVSPDGATPAERTRADMVFCTPLYASPELLRGKPDFRTDLYALGLVMAEMLDGNTPYTAEACALLESPHLERTPVPLGERTLASGLGSVIARACAKRLDERYASAVEMLADLEIAYEAIREPDYKESPLRIVPPPPSEATEKGGTSRFVPVSSIGVDEFDSILDYDSRGTMIVGASGAASPAVQVDPIVGVPEIESDVTAPVVARPAPDRRRRVGAWILSVAALLLLGLAIALRPSPTPSTPSSPNVVATPLPDRATTAQPPSDTATNASVRGARRAVAQAHLRSAASMLIVYSDITATVRLDGIPVGEVTADAPLITAGPSRRPYSLELVAPGVMFSRSVTNDGPVHVAAELAALQRDTLNGDAPPVAVQPTTPAPTPRPASRPRPRTLPDPPTPTVTEPERPSAETPDPPVRLGDPIRPRTQ